MLHKFPHLFSYDDIWMVPLCFLLIYVFAYNIRLKYNNSIIKQYFFPALFIRLVFTIIYSLIIQYYYNGQADTNVYYQATMDMHDAVYENGGIWQDIYFNKDIDISNPVFRYLEYDQLDGYTRLVMSEPKNWMVSKVGLPFSLLFNKNYLSISIFISVFAFAGSWRIFKTFYALYPHLHRKLAIACLFLPSVIFWGVGLIKDSISIGALGFVFYGLYQIFFRKKKILISTLIVIACGWLLYSVKPYILLCFAPAFLIWLFIRFNRSIDDKTLRGIAGVMFTLLAVGAGFMLLQYFTSSEESQRFATENLMQTVQSQQSGFQSAEGQGSSFSVGEASGTGFGGIILLFPMGVVASLFRPFPWDVRSPLMLLSALEALGFIALTYMAFKKIGFSTTFKMIFTDPLTLFCFVYSVLFAGFVGITTPNFGALVRYKIPCLPFYLVMLFIIMDKSGKFSSKYVFSKKYF